MKKLLLMFTLVTVTLISCKKKDVEKTTAEKVQGLWKLESLNLNSFYSNTNHFDNYTGTAADYLDFRADNKVYSQIDSEKDTVGYTIVNDNTIKIEGEDLTIQTLTDQQFKIYQKTIDPSAPSEYEEITVTMKK